jgi:predicted oxidoreductase (fatty acid repression mutant protein)
MEKSEIGEAIREVTRLLNNLAEQFDSLSILFGESAKKVMDFVKKHSEEVVISQEDYENLAVVMSKFKQAIKTAPEPIKSTMEFSYYLGFMNGMLKSKGIVV